MGRGLGVSAAANCGLAILELEKDRRAIGLIGEYIQEVNLVVNALVRRLGRAHRFHRDRLGPGRMPDAASGGHGAPARIQTGFGPTLRQSGRILVPRDLRPHTSLTSGVRQRG